MAQAAATAFAQTGKTYVHTGGVWAWGNNADISEDDPFAPPVLTSWRPDVEKIALGIPGARSVVIAPGVVYGEGGGIPNLLVSGPRNDAGALTTIGSGEQHWVVVHAADLADLYLLALTNPQAQGYYLAAGSSSTVKELSQAAAGASGTVAETAQATAERLGELFAEALLLDQQGSGLKARTELGWTPAGPTLVEELRTGSYTNR